MFNLQGLLGNGMINELKFGYNAAQVNDGRRRTSPVFDGIALSLSGTVANSGIAGQGGNSAAGQPRGPGPRQQRRQRPRRALRSVLADVRGLAQPRRRQPLPEARRRRPHDPDDAPISWAASPTPIRTSPGSSPTRRSSIQYFGDLSEPSPFHDGASGAEHIEQEYYVAFAQDEWRVNPKLTLNYGLRYDYYVPLREADNRIVKFNIDTGTLDPDTTPLYQSKKNNFQPRVSVDVRADRTRPCCAAGSASSSARARPKIRFSRSRPSASAPR